MMYQILRIIGMPVSIPAVLSQRSSGKKNTRIKGRAIIISNHISMWDPLMISVIFRRHIYWMGKIELFKNQVCAVFLQCSSRLFPCAAARGTCRHTTHIPHTARRQAVRHIPGRHAHQNRRA